MNPRQEARLFQFPEVRVVEASAGSGKTYCLARRYIQLLLTSNNSFPLPLRHILAITFTNKAAFEMKARILELLKKISLRQCSKTEEENILLPVGVDGNQASLITMGMMDDLICHYNFFQVQTIDSFINALLSGCAFKIGLTANFRIKTNSSEYLEHSLDELIDQAHRDKKILKVFEQFLNHYLYLENRMGWFPKKDMLGIMTAVYQQHNRYGLDYALGPIAQEDIIKLKRSILEDIKTFLVGI